MRIEINPADVTRGEYLEGLDRSFRDAWSETAYAWYLARPHGGEPPDLVVGKGDVLLCGMALNYRTLTMDEGEYGLIAIITGAWTSPEYRGRGLFKRLILEGKQRARLRGAELMIGFVTADNSSRRSMAGCGAVEIPSWYLKSSLSGGDVDHTLGSGRALDQTTLSTLMSSEGRGCVRFGYGDEDWISQYVERPLPVFSLTGCRWTALVEDAGHTWRLLKLVSDHSTYGVALSALASGASRAGSRLLAFTTVPEEREVAVQAGLTPCPGAVTCIPLGTKENGSVGFGSHACADLLRMRWVVHGGDRM